MQIFLEREDRARTITCLRGAGEGGRGDRAWTIGLNDQRSESSSLSSSFAMVPGSSIRPPGQLTKPGEMSSIEDIIIIISD